MIRHGRIVSEWYSDGTKPAELLSVYSVTKSVCSTAVGMAIGKGKLALDTPLGQFICPIPRPAEEKQADGTVEPNCFEHDQRRAKVKQ